MPIAQHWQTGMGFGADRALIGENFFVHNIFLELIIDFGIPVSLLVLFLYWKPIFRIRKLSFFSISTALIITLVTQSWVQLMFSSSYLMNMLNLMFIYGVAKRLSILQINVGEKRIV